MLLTCTKIFYQWYFLKKLQLSYVRMLVKAFPVLILKIVWLRFPDGVLIKYRLLFLQIFLLFKIIFLHSL